MCTPYRFVVPGVSYGTLRLAVQANVNFSCHSSMNNPTDSAQLLTWQTSVLPLEMGRSHLSRARLNLASARGTWTVVGESLVETRVWLTKNLI
jgi:hypothetical protein